MNIKISYIISLLVLYILVIILPIITKITTTIQIITSFFKAFAMLPSFGKKFDYYHQELQLMPPQG